MFLDSFSFNSFQSFIFETCSTVHILMNSHINEFYAFICYCSLLQNLQELDWDNYQLVQNEERYNFRPAKLAKGTVKPVKVLWPGQPCWTKDSLRLLSLASHTGQRIERFFKMTDRIYYNFICRSVLYRPDDIITA